MEVVKVGGLVRWKWCKLVDWWDGSGEGQWTGGMEVVKVGGLVGWKW